MLGLLDAAKRFRPEEGKVFEAYAFGRIHGAMMDEMREMDWMPRSARSAQKDIAIALRAAEQKHGRRPNASEVAEMLEISLDDYFVLRDVAAGTRYVSVDEMEGDDGESFYVRNVPDETADLERRLEEKRRSADLSECVRLLPETQRTVLSKLDEGMKLREVGDLLNVTESRACQIRAEAIKTLRVGLAEWA